MSDGPMNEQSDLPEFRERGIAAIRLLQGVIYECEEQVWSILLANETGLADYFCEIGMALVIDRAEGLAYLKQFDDSERSGGYERLPKLFRRTSLGYEATLLCVLLRDEYRRFEEEDLDNERCIVSLNELFESWKSYFPAASDEISLRKSLIKSFNQLDKLRFVRNIKSDSDAWEVCKLLKARIAVDELEDLLVRMKSFALPQESR